MLMLHYIVYKVYGFYYNKYYNFKLIKSRKNNFILNIKNKKFEFNILNLLKD